MRQERRIVVRFQVEGTSYACPYGRSLCADSSSLAAADLALAPAPSQRSPRRPARRRRRCRCSRCPDARTNRAYISNTIALASDGRTIVTANMINNSMTILIPAFDRVVAEIPVGKDPRSVALTPDSTRALVANHGDGTLSVVSLTSERRHQHDPGRRHALRRRHRQQRCRPTSRWKAATRSPSSIWSTDASAA